MSADKMPPLPAPSEHGRFPGPHGYSEGDMHAYARAYAAEQTRELVEALDAIRLALRMGIPAREILADDSSIRHTAFALIAKHKGAA